MKKAIIRVFRKLWELMATPSMRKVVQENVYDLPKDPKIKKRINDYLKQEGWLHSATKDMPIDKEENEIPWFTYSSIRFIESRLKKDHDIFEFGSGNSTLWFSNRCAQVISVEHDEEWYQLVKEKLTSKPNTKYLYKDLESGDYSNTILEYNNQFDIIIIDGRDRIKCAKNALGALKENGIIIWDNSDRDIYQEGYDFLTNNGFKRVDFMGTGPINSYAWGTSIFYRNENCFML